MKNSDLKHAPSLKGWFIAAGMGLVAAVVAFLVGNFTYSQSAIIGAAIFLLAGLIFGLNWGSAAVVPAKLVGAQTKPAADPLAAEPLMAAPAMAETAPAAFKTAPVADAAPTPAKAARVAKPKATAKSVVAKDAAKPAAPKVAKVKKPDGPVRLSAPRKGKADDLKEIEGIGPALEKLCNSLGFYHFDQIAGWSDADVAWVDANMKTFRGRIVRDKWIAQSKIILSEGLEAFRVRAQTNNY